MASSIIRDTWTNDSGTAVAPAGDGTILNNSVLQNNIYARIDAMFAGAGGYSTLTLGGLIAVTGFGTSSFDAGGSGDQQVRVRNTSAGTGNSSTLALGNDSSSLLYFMRIYSSTYTPVTYYDRQSGCTLVSQGAGGLGIAATNASGNIYFYTGGALRGQLYTSGGLCIGTTPSDPGADTLATTGTLSVLGGKILFPSTQVPSANVNTLDDYEEGTWTPVIGGSGGTSGQTYTTQAGSYIKIGSMVWASCDVLLSAKGSITGNLEIHGLPFTAANAAQAQYGGAVAYWNSTSSSFVSMSSYVTLNTTIAPILGTTAAATNMSALSTSDINNTTHFIISYVYQAAN
jgi:hypothetical protein